MHEASLGSFGIHRPALHLRTRLLQHRSIVRVEQRLRVLAHQVVGVVAERLTGGAVDADQPKLAIEQQRGNRALVKQRAEALRAFGQIGFRLLARADVACEQQHELAPVVHHSLQHRFNGEFSVEPRLVPRIDLIGAARLQLFI